MNILKSILSFIGLFLSYVWPLSVNVRFQQILNAIYTGYLRKSFGYLGKDTYFTYKSSFIHGMNYMRIGDDSFFGRGIRLTATYRPADREEKPQLVIGNGCNFGERNHITAFNRITIGDNLLTGINVLITDNAHGTFDLQELNTSPIKRKLFSKGPVVIDDNVWIGSNSCIMPGVTIGRGAIIGANAVVTKDVPPYCVATGNPARVVKQFE